MVVRRRRERVSTGRSDEMASGDGLLGKMVMLINGARSRTPFLNVSKEDVSHPAAIDQARRSHVPVCVCVVGYVMRLALAV